MFRLEAGKWILIRFQGAKFSSLRWKSLFFKRGFLYSEECLLVDPYLDKVDNFKPYWDPHP